MAKMTSVERIRVKIEAIEDEPSPKQVLTIVGDILDLLDEKEKIGFNNEGK